MINTEAASRIRNFLEMTDLDFYNRYLRDASLEELAEFCREFPGFPGTNVGDIPADTEDMLVEIKKKLGI